MRTSIDSRTLLFAAALVSGAFAPLMYLTMRSRKTFPGYGRWTASMASFSAGLLVLVWRGLTPDAESVVLGYLLLIVGLLLSAEGIRLYCGQVPRVPWAYACFAAIFALQLYYSAGQNTPRARVLFGSLLTIFLRIYAALPMLGAAPEGRKLGYRFTAVVLLFSVPVAIFRLFALTIFTTTPEFSANSVTNIAYYACMVLFIVGLAFCFFLLTNERLVADLHVANGALKAETEERLRIQRQLVKMEKMEAIGRLAGGVAHIVNTQMCVIGLSCGQLESLRAEPLPALSRISRAAERTAHVASRLMQFAHLNPLCNVKFDIALWLEGISGDIRRTLGDSITLKIESVGAELTVFADVQQLSEVMLSIAANARVAMPDGGSWTLLVERIHLTDAGENEGLTLRGGVYIRVSATDTGSGMDEKAAKRLFEPFCGTGGMADAEELGLASALGVLEQSGGTMTAESTATGGSTLRLYLPAAA